MKKIVCILFILSLTGCMFIVREDDSVKGAVGISKEKAKEEITALDSVTAAGNVRPLSPSEGSK